MHLLLRTILTLLRSFRRPPLDIFGVSSVPMRVLPTDIDIAMHVNNGMYLSLMDLGRFDLMARSGLWKTMRRRGWTPVVGNETISFRKSLQLWQRYSIETRILGFDEKSVYFQHRMVVDGEVYAEAHVAGRLVSKKGPVSNEEIFEAAGRRPPAEMVLPEWIKDWRLNVALPSTRKPAPHTWLS